MPHNHIINELNASCDSTSGRPDNDIHASDLERFCAREYIICLTHNLPYHPIRRLSRGESVTFDLGNRLHDLVRNRLAKRGVLYGGWRCNACKHQYFGLSPTGDQKCPKCGKVSWRYKEVKVRFEKHGFKFSGSLDSIVAHTPSSAFVNEIKSINAEDYKTLQQPLLEHTHRVNAYLWMIRETDSVLLNKIGVSKEHGTVTYISKGHCVKNLPWKSFTVTEDKLYMDSLEEKLEELKAYSKKKTLPKCICRDENTMMARTCKVTKLCFKGA